MKNLKNKLKKQGGFTLVEMLTVVAIIAILIAISIPMVTGALDRAKKATDAANVRAAKATMSIESLTNASYVDGTIKAYNAATGALDEADADITPYGKEDNKNIIYATEVKDIVFYQWEAPKATLTAPVVDDDGTVSTTNGWETEVKPNGF